MSLSLHAQISEIAYYLWLEDGRADGRASEHWAAAERLVLMPRPARASRVKTPAKLASAPKKAARQPLHA